MDLCTFAPHVSRGAIRWTAALMLTTAAAGPAHALDPSRAPSQYVIKRWGADSALPSSGIHALVQTRDRYLWLGTGAGLVRFDGARFAVAGAPDAPHFGEGGVSSLSEAADGALYFGTTAGSIIQHKDGLFTRLAVQAGAGPVSSLLAARDGSVWIARFGRPLTRWVHQRATSLADQVQTTGPLAVAEDADGSVWIGTRQRGLFRLRHGRVDRYDTAKGLADNMVQALHVDRGGTLWIGTPAGLCRLRDGAIACFTERDGLSHASVLSVLEDRDGNLWVGTAGGLNRYRDGRFVRITSREGLSDDEIRCLLEDHEGSLWVGTADGLNRISDGRFISYGRLEGLHDTAVRCVVPGAGGAVWVGTAGGTVARLRDGVVTNSPGLAAEGIIALHEARDGSLWVADDGGRLLRVERGSAVSDHTPRDARRSWKFSAITEDGEGLLFFITSVGLARVRERRVVPVSVEAESLGYVSQLHRDRRGGLWICGSKGLGRLRDGRLEVFTSRHGLPHDRVRWISEDDDGGLWLATIGGLAYFKDGRARSVTVRNGLPEVYLRLVLDDGGGHLWIAAMGSIFRLAKREVFDVLAGRASALAPVRFDTSDGLRTTETLLASDAGFRGADGRLWFATAKGVSVIDPARVELDHPAPAALVETVTVDGRTGIRDVYPPGRGEVLIEYTALSFRSLSRTRFRYRLEGFDRDWVDAGVRRTAYYSNLPPGRYRFLVMASNGDGLWNGRASMLAFAVEPPFTGTPLFYLLCAGLLVGLVALAHRLRVGQMRARFAAIIGERTRIARELHDTLAQGLAGVGIQIDTALRRFPEQPELARGHVQLARAMVRSSLAEVRRSIWVLRAQTSKGSSGLGPSLSDSLAQLTADSGIESTIRISGQPRRLQPELEHNLLRIAHEAVINAVRHASASTIAIGLDFDAEAVGLRVRDDGAGFDAGACLARNGGHHFGLVGISERAQALGGCLRVDSHPGGGTEVVCRLPYNCRIDPGEIETRQSEGASP